jgi:hypothetical protein
LKIRNYKDTANYWKNKQEPKIPKPAKALTPGKAKSQKKQATKRLKLGKGGDVVCSVTSPGDATDDESVCSVSLDSTDLKQKTLEKVAPVIIKPYNPAKEAALAEIARSKIRRGF